MVLAHSLFRGNVAEHVILLLIGSSHVHWTCSALLRYKLLGFFSSLLGPQRCGFQGCGFYPGQPSQKTNSPPASPRSVHYAQSAGLGGGGGNGLVNLESSTGTLASTSDHL